MERNVIAYKIQSNTSLDTALEARSSMKWNALWNHQWNKMLYASEIYVHHHETKKSEKGGTGFISYIAQGSA